MFKKNSWRYTFAGYHIQQMNPKNIVFSSEGNPLEKGGNLQRCAQTWVNVPFAPPNIALHLTQRYLIFFLALHLDVGKLYSGSTLTAQRSKIQVESNKIQVERFKIFELSARKFACKRRKKRSFLELQGGGGGIRFGWMLRIYFASKMHQEVSFN